MNIGFIGLGVMGSGMARNLARAGHQVKVYNRTRTKAEALEPDGAIVVDRPEKVCEEADVLITMLADDNALEAVIEDDPEFLPALPRGAIHMAMGTISVAKSKRIEEIHLGHGHKFIAAPVLGRGDVAEAGQLAIIAAGAPDVIETCQPLLDIMGRKTYYTGSAPYSANTAKLCMNFMLAAAIESLGEAFAVVRKAEIDPELFLDLVTGTLFPTPVHKVYGDMQARDDYTSANFTVTLGLKDVNLAAEAAEDLNVPLPMAGVVRDQLINALAHEEADQDWSVVGRVAMRNAGLAK